MSKITFFATSLFVLLLVVACGPSKDRIRMKGELNNVNEAEFYVFSEDGAFDGMDTVRISDGKFEYERQLNAPAVLTLLYPNFTKAYVVAEPGQTVKLKGDASHLSEIKISGTEQNELYSDFRIKNLNTPERTLRLAAAQFIRENARTLAAVAAFRTYFTDKENPDAHTALPLLDLLKKEQPKERAVTYLDQFYRPILVNGVGERLPNFTARTMDGKEVSTQDYKGKNLVIVCMAYWESDTRSMLRQVRSKIRSLGGKWQCLVVSLDVDNEMLRSNLKSDSIAYPVICDRQSFNSPLVTQLGLHYVPSLMLVNDQGIITQRDVTDIKDAKF